MCGKLSKSIIVGQCVVTQCLLHEAVESEGSDDGRINHRFLGLERATVARILR